MTIEDMARAAVDIVTAAGLPTESSLRALAAAAEPGLRLVRSNAEEALTVKLRSRLRATAPEASDDELLQSLWLAAAMIAQNRVAEQDGDRSEERAMVVAAIETLVQMYMEGDRRVVVESAYRTLHAALHKSPPHRNDTSGIPLSPSARESEDARELRRRLETKYPDVPAERLDVFIRAAALQLLLDFAGDL